MGSHTSKPADADANPLTGVSFDLNGETFTCHGRVSMFRMAETSRRLAEAGAARQNIGMAMAAESMSEALGPAEYARFVDFFIDRDINDDAVIDIIADINEQAEANVVAAAGRPTKPSSGSSGGEPAKAALPARIINLGEPGGNLRTLDGASPDDLKAAAEATRVKPPTARKSRSRAAS